MSTNRVTFAALTVSTVWIAVAVVAVNNSVESSVAIVAIVSSVVITALASQWVTGRAGSTGGLPQARALPATPAPSSPLSIVSPVAVVNDGSEERVLNCFESAGTERDWGLDSLLEDEADGAGTPLQVDLRAGWWTVANQGTTGSCVGWACADSVLRWHFVDAERLAEDEPLSVRYVWMASKETDRFTSRPTAFLDRSGTSIKAAVDIARKYGVVTDKDLGFRQRETSSLKASAFYARAAAFRIGSYINLIPTSRRGNPDSNDNVQRTWWRYWLHNHGPILTRLDVDDAFRDRATKKLTAYSPGAKAGHAVAIVGYDAAGVTIRNSWGERWGDDGFKHASWDYAAKAFTDAYGVRL